MFFNRYNMNIIIPLYLILALQSQLDNKMRIVIAYLHVKSFWKNFIKKRRWNLEKDFEGVVWGYPFKEKFLRREELWRKTLCNLIVLSQNSRFLQPWWCWWLSFNIKMFFYWGVFLRSFIDGHVNFITYLSKKIDKERKRKGKKY